MFGISSLMSEPANAASQSVLMPQDAVIPGFDLNLVEGTDSIGQLRVNNIVVAGQQLNPSYAKHVTIDGNDGEVEAMAYMFYAESPLDAVEKFNEYANIYFHPGYLPQLKNDMQGNIVLQDLGQNSKTLIYMTKNFWFLNYYYGVAYKVEYIPQYPNFAYFVIVNGAFTGASVLQNYLSTLSNHCATIIQAAHVAVAMRETPTPTPNTDANKEQFAIQYCTGQVYVQRGGTGPWLPATTGMMLNPFDAVKTVGRPTLNHARLVFGDNRTILNNNLPRAYQVDIGGGQIVLLSSQDVSKMGFPDLSIPKPEPTLDEENIVFSSLLPHPPMTITTPDGIIHDSQTEFQIIVNSSGTTVYTFTGSVTLSDLSGNNIVEVRANQVASVKQGDAPSTPLSFNPNNVDRSWVDSAYPQPSPTVPEYPLIVVFLLLVTVTSTTAWFFKRRLKKGIF